MGCGPGGHPAAERVGASRPVGPTAAHKAKNSGAKGQGKGKGAGVQCREKIGRTWEDQERENWGVGPV